MDDNCCQDQTVVLEVEDEQTLSPTFKLSVPDMTFIAAFAAVWTALFELYEPAYTLCRIIPRLCSRRTFLCSCNPSCYKPAFSMMPGLRGQV
jgi:hypothetical protein